MAIALNTVIVDGQEYKPGDVIPDFKSIKCVDTREPRKYQGLSADVSVLNDVIAKYASGGASCFMSDTGEYYEYDREEKTWKLITNITERGFDSEKAYGALKHMLKNVTVSDEKIQSAVTDYLTVNPVLPGATTEQAQQIEQNKTDVALLKEDTGLLNSNLANLKIKKINVADYRIKDNGEDVADAVLNLIERFKWQNVNLYFPSGTYKFSKPIRFYGRVNVIGEPFAFTATERSRTVFDFSLIDSQESETYCVTCDYFTLFKNITLYSDAYTFTENRNAFLSDRDVMPFVGTVNKQNISGINFDDYGHAENLYVFGFSKTGINMHDYGLAKDITFRSTNEPMIIGTDNIIDNIRFDKCGTCISSMGGENIVTKLRADSIIEKCITVIGGQNQIKDCVFDWVYKNALDIRGNGNVIDISSGRCGIKSYDVNPVTTKLSFSGDNGTNFAVVRLTNSGTYAPKGNKIRISGYRIDVSDDNSEKWLYTPFITIVTDGVSPLQENYFDLSVSDVDLSAENLNAETYRRFINFFYTTKQFSAMCLLNMVPVKIKNADSDNYATSFKQASYE